MVLDITGVTSQRSPSSGTRDIDRKHKSASAAIGQPLGGRGIARMRSWYTVHSALLSNAEWTVELLEALPGETLFAAILGRRPSWPML